MTQMKLSMKQEQTYRHGNETCSCQGRAEGEGEAQQVGSQGALVATGSSELVPRPWPQKQLPFPSPEQAAVTFSRQPALLAPNLGPGLRAPALPA